LKIKLAPNEGFSKPFDFGEAFGAPLGASKRFIEPSTYWLTASRSLEF